MAAKYKVIASHETVELVGATDTRDVVQVMITTSPSGVTFPLRVPDTQFSEAAIAALAEDYSNAIERWIAEPSIAGMRYEQNVNAAGDLVDEFVFVVQSASGQLTREITQPILILLLGNIDPIIGPIAAELDRIEAL